MEDSTHQNEYVGQLSGRITGLPTTQTVSKNVKKVQSCGDNFKVESANLTEDAKPSTAAANVQYEMVSEHLLKGDTPRRGGSKAPLLLHGLPDEPEAEGSTKKTTSTEPLCMRRQTAPASNIDGVHFYDLAENNGTNLGAGNGKEDFSRVQSEKSTFKLSPDVSAALSPESHDNNFQCRGNVNVNPNGGLNCERDYFNRSRHNVSISESRRFHSSSLPLAFFDEKFPNHSNTYPKVGGQVSECVESKDGSAGAAKGYGYDHRAFIGPHSISNEVTAMKPSKPGTFDTTGPTVIEAPLSTKGQENAAQRLVDSRGTRLFDESEIQVPSLSTLLQVNNKEQHRSGGNVKSSRILNTSADASTHLDTKQKITHTGLVSPPRSTFLGNSTIPAELTSTQGKSTNLSVERSEDEQEIVRRIATVPSNDNRNVPRRGNGHEHGTAPHLSDDVPLLTQATGKKRILVLPAVTQKYTIDDGESRPHKKSSSSQSGVSFVCQVGGCYRQFGNRTALRRHHAHTHQISLPTSQHTCKICKARFRNVTNLRRHESNAHREAKVQCSSCFVWFNNFQSLRAHNMKSTWCHLKCLESTVGPEKDSKDSDCQESLTTNSYLGLPARSSTTSGITGPNIGSKGSSSEQNDAAVCIPDVTREQREVVAVGREFSCDLCAYSTKFKGNLKRHKGIVHYNRRPFPCDKCGRTFSTKTNLRIHSDRNHGSY